MRARSLRAAPSALALRAAALLCAALLFAAATARAAPAGTGHSTPVYNVAGVSFQCGAAQNYSCTGGGYGAGSAAASGWPWAKYGGSWASYVGSDPHNCTLYAAFRVEQNGQGDPGWSDNANGWANKAWAHGTPVDQTPAPGAIAQWNVPGQFGHVAYVESSDGGGIVITEDNYIDSSARYYPGGYTARIHIAPGSPAWPDNFIHFRDQPGGGGGGGGGSPPPPSCGLKEGCFISNNGAVYRIAGGAPIYVSTWAAVGGSQPTTDVSDAQLAALPQVPADGTVLNASGGGVFIAAGGAPLYLSSYDAIGGPKPGIGIDQAAVDNAGGGPPWSHLRAVPADGTLLATASGPVYVVVGGAPLFVSAWSAIGGSRPSVLVDAWDIDNLANPAAHLRALPADGSALRDHATGAEYLLAGGAPLYVSGWDAVGGERAAVDIDPWDLDHLGAPAAHLDALPAEGTFLRATGGAVYVVAGGAPVLVHGWSAVGGERPAVPLDQWDLDHLGDAAVHLRALPADGTFLSTLAGPVYRVAGGAPFFVGKWALFGGVQPSVTVDPWTIDHRGDPSAHLAPAPADLTRVRGLPSKTCWQFHAGLRARASCWGSSSVDVDDLGLLDYPLFVAPLPDGGLPDAPPLGVPLPETSDPSAGGCSAGGGALAWALLPLALLGVGAQRRRRSL